MVYKEAHSPGHLPKRRLLPHKAIHRFITSNMPTTSNTITQGTSFAPGTGQSWNIEPGAHQDLVSWLANLQQS